MSFLSTVICAFAAAAHYQKSHWGDVWQPMAWLLSMVFLMLAFLPGPHKLGFTLKAVLGPKTAFFIFWILFYVVSHLWNFSRAPWNGNALFDESGWDLWYLKSYVIGHPFQPAWFHFPISRETLFHYYVWGFLKLFGFNILSYEAALFVIWLTTFLFTLLLVDLFFNSYVVTSVAALVLNFLPFAFIYTFAGYRYPMATALAVVSLYFLHLGFRAQLINTEGCSHGAVRRSENPVAEDNDAPPERRYSISETACRTRSHFCLSAGGIAAGLCLASSISGKQYLLALAIAAPLYALSYWRSLTRTVTWSSLGIAGYGFLAAAAPILLYIAFNRNDYTLYENSFVRDFWNAMQSAPFPRGVRHFTKELWDCFFAVPGPRFFIPDVLPIPLPYYWLLVPGFALALWQKRFAVVLLAVIPVGGAFVAKAIENRLLLPIPFWVILISFTCAAILKLPRSSLKIVLGAVTVLILLNGLVPSVRYIYAKTENPFLIRYYAQQEVAVSRFLKHVVAGQEHPDPPHLERDEFNRIQGSLNPPYETFICPREAYSIIHLFLHDYDDAKVLSFCGGTPFYVTGEQDVWNANKRAVLTYTPGPKDLKLIWERDPKTERIITMFQTVRDLGTEDSLSFSFGGMMRRFYVLNIPNKNVREFQDRIAAFPATSDLKSIAKGPPTVFEGSKGRGKGQFDSPTAMAVDRSGNLLVADTGNGRIEKFTPTGSFITSIGPFEAPSGIAVDRAGNIYVSEIGSKHSVQKFDPEGKFIAEWKDPGFYGPRRIAIGPDDSIYVIDSGHNRIVKLSSDGQLLTTWGSEGSADGQFKGISSVAIDPTNNKVYVADPLNHRIQVFDSNGKFLTKWSIPEWGQTLGFEDLAIDSQTGRLYTSSAHMNSVLIFDFGGTRIGRLPGKPSDKLDGPSALALVNWKLYVLNMTGSRVSAIDLKRQDH